MGRSPDLCWQVLQDEDEWWEETDEARAEAGPLEEARPARRKVVGWPLLSLGVAVGLLLAQLLWLAVGPVQEAGTSAAAAAPDPPRYVWESDYFVFAYAGQHRDAAAAAARLLDARYGAVRRALGLSPAGEKEKIALAGEGVALADLDAFVCAGLSGLTEEAVAQALPLTGEAGSWRVTPGFVLGLRGWAQGTVCPEAVAGQGERFGQAFGGRVPRLAELHPAVYDFPYRGAGPGQAEREGAAFALLLAYAQERYGPGRLPLLLAAVQQPATWEAFIPGVFGVPAEEFEAGWRAWLDEVYGGAR